MTERTVSISNIAEFRAVAAEFGVAMPARQGRPPVRKLAQALKDAGVTVQPTEYFSGVVAKTTAASPASYVVKARLPQTAKGNVRRYAAKGKHADKAGQAIPQPRVSEYTITAAQIREFARSQDDSVGTSGPLSAALTVPAVAALAGWGDVSDLTDVTVERV